MTEAFHAHTDRQK